MGCDLIHFNTTTSDTENDLQVLHCVHCLHACDMEQCCCFSSCDLLSVIVFDQQIGRTFPMTIGNAISAIHISREQAMSATPCVEV